jgi:hypothetical protein
MFPETMHCVIAVLVINRRSLIDWHGEKPKLTELRANNGQSGN